MNGGSNAFLIKASSVDEGQIVQDYSQRSDYNKFGAAFFRVPGGFVYIPSTQFPSGDALAQQPGVTIVDQFQYVSR